MSKHTPGKWEIGYKDNSGPEYITSEDKAIVALRWGCDCCKNNPDSFADLNPEEQANARLIAAAPELLEALQNVVKQAEANPFLAVGMLIEHHSRIREVIAKAEGRG